LIEIGGGHPAARGFLVEIGGGYSAAGAFGEETAARACAGRGKGSMTERALESAVAQAFGEWVVRRRWALIVLCLMFAALSAYGLAFLTVNPDNRVFFDADNPDRLALDALERTYTKDSNVMIVLAPKSGNVFTREMLSLVEDLTAKAWQVPYSRRVDSITNFQHSYATGDDLVIEDLVTDAAGLADDDLARVRAVALGRPQLVNRIVSPKGDVTAVNVVTLMPGKSLSEVPEIATFARGLAGEVRAAHPDVAVYLTGVVMIDMAFAEASRADSTTLVPIMLVLIVVVLGLFVRTLAGTLVTVAVIAMAVTTALGLSGWAGVVLNSATAATPIIIMTLSVAACVHFLTTFRQLFRPGVDKSAAIAESTRVNLQPVTITSATTAIGFLTLNFGDSPPLRELGSIVAVGMAAAFVYAVFFLPAMMAVLPLRRGKTAAKRPGFMVALANFVVARYRVLLIGSGIVIAGLTAGTAFIVLDDDFIRYFDDRYQFRVDTDFTENRLTGLHVVDFSLPAGEEQGIARPDYLSNLEAFATWLRGQDKVAYVWTLTDTMKRLNQNMHGDDPAYYRIPENRELAAQYLITYELSVPYGLDLNSRIDVAKSATRLTAVMPWATSAEIRRLAARAEAWLATNAPDMKSRATGVSIMFAHISHRNIRAMLRGTVLALVLISLILLVVLRSVKIGLVSLAPNLFPAAMAFGLWGYLFQEVNLAISVVMAMTLGIVVDDTVYFLTKYLRGRRERGMDPVESVRFAFRRVGMALLITSIALVIGFGVLATSGFAVNGDMGLLTALTIAVALVADFLFLPALLIAIEGRAR